MMLPLDGALKDREKSSGAAFHSTHAQINTPESTMTGWLRNSTTKARSITIQPLEQFKTGGKSWSSSTAIDQ